MPTPEPRTTATARANRHSPPQNPAALSPAPPKPWHHHSAVLNRLVTSLQPGGQASVQTLRNLYGVVRTDWTRSRVAVIGGTSQADAWLREVAEGLNLFAATEGW